MINFGMFFAFKNYRAMEEKLFEKQMKFAFRSFNKHKQLLLWNIY